MCVIRLAIMNIVMIAVMNIVGDLACICLAVATLNSVNSFVLLIYMVDRVMF